jgi:asparagine synthase (glutamine-hydrolysing)
MCGIVGFSGGFPRAALAAANSRQCHRGPDDRGEFYEEAAQVGLGHVRLSILDLSPLGHQPMRAADDTVVLVFNGEIYNFRELRSELESRGRRFKGTSDTEVLLQLYLDEGAAMLPRLNGIFALAVWDGRVDTLLIARDALGVKPVYLLQNARGVAFASEMKALLQMVPEARELDPIALYRYLTFLWCPGEGTPLKGVRKLGPGEALEVRGGRVVRHWPWYELPLFRGVRPTLGEDAAVEGTVSHLREAVHRQLVADVPVGAFLSGGLDSSAIVAFARERVQDIQCFTIESGGGAEQGVADDLPYARQVAAHLGVQLHVVRVEAERMASDLQAMVEQLDEPLADPAPLNVLYISQLARSHGMKVMLSGAGGDDLFTGYRRHRALELEKYWSWLPRSARSAIGRGTTALDQRRPASRRLAKLFANAGLLPDERLASYFAWTTPTQALSLFAPGVRSDLAAVAPSEPMLRFLSPLPPSASPLERMLALEQRFFLTDHNLLYTDKMSMAAGVEVRVPFLDLDLVEFSARVPTQVKQRRGQGKWVLKKAMEPYLPKRVIYRPKTGFGAPLRRWMRHELRPLLADMLSPERVAARGLLDPTAVKRLIAENDRGATDAAYTLFSLLCIEVWCSHFLGGAPASA